jgi:predicted XRE-type DNA-binding protein
MAIKPSSGNVFFDIGFDAFEAEEMAVKSDLISVVGLAIRKRGLTQAQAAKLCGTHQTTLSKVLSGKLDSITLDQLTKWIVALGGNVEISVSSPAKTKSVRRGSLTFHTSR